MIPEKKRIPRMHHKNVSTYNYSKVTEEETARERQGTARKQHCESIGAGRGGTQG